jgi:hypothetical protein
VVKKSIVAICLAASATLAAVQPTFAGILATDPLAYNDGATWWHGSTFYASSSLNGTIDWAVYAPGDFALAFPGSTYTPPPDMMTYVYQINEVGDSPVSTLNVAFVDVSRPKFAIGTFSLGGMSEWATIEPPALNPTTAHWFFAGIPAGGSSVGLVFSSPNKPETYAGSLVNEGMGAVAVGLPSPSTYPVPEPSSIALAIAGAMLLGGFVVRRGKNR